MLSRTFWVLFLCAAAAFCATSEKAPRPSPDLAINLNDGSQIHVSQYRGKVTVVAFILTYCPHCQFTAEILSRLNKEYGPRGFQVVASSIEDMAVMMVPDFIKKFQPGFPVGFNQRAEAIEYLQHPPMYQLMMPQVVVIDRKGMIRAQFAGNDKFFDKPEQEKNFRAVIEPLLKEGTAAETHKKGGKKRG